MYQLHQLSFRKYPDLKSEFNVILHFVLESESHGHHEGQFDDIKIFRNNFFWITINQNKVKLYF